MTIDGGGQVTVDGADAHAPFTVVKGTVTLAGLTVTGGVGANYAPTAGGGIWNAGTLTVQGLNDHQQLRRRRRRHLERAAP